MIGKTYRSTYTILGGIPQVKFVVAKAKRDRETGLVSCRSALSSEWYPLMWAVVE
jgi:hypothetical protein